MTKTRLNRTTLLLATTSLGLIAAAAAHAAPAAAPASKDAAEVQEIVVTGSSLPTTPDRVVAPVTTVDAHKIDVSGNNTNALEILRKTVPAFQGRGNVGASNANNTNQNTGGGSQVRLRDLDTLILINGRRVAPDAIAGVGGKIFVDVNQIPPSAIERVEVLADGASAIYGSDAIGGVVNFVLKQKFDGLEVGGRYGGADGGYAERSGYFTAGHSFGDRIDVVLDGSYSETDPLYQKDRSFTHPFIVSSTAVPGAVGTNLLNLNLNSPSQSVPTGINATASNIAALIPSVYFGSNAAGIGATYDLSQFQTLLLREKTQAIGGNLTVRLTENGSVQAFSDFEYAHVDTFTQFLPRISAVTVPAGAPFNPTTGAVAGVQFGDPGLPKQYFNKGDKFRITAGLKGEFDLAGKDWRWETAYTYSEDKLDQRQANVIYGPNLPLAIAGGFNAAGVATPGGAFSKVFSNFDTNSPLVIAPALDPFARGGRNPASLTNVFGTELISGKSTLESGDVQVNTTELFQLPGGKVGVAIGGAWRREALSASADLNGRNTGPTAQRWIGGQFFDPFSKSRTIYSVFGEVRVPITGDDFTPVGFHAFEIVGAFRYEHYSDAGDSTVPKVGFRWEPVDNQLVIRGTYSRSFTAPSLYAEYGPTDTRQAGGAIIQGAFPGQPSSPFNAEDGNNPNLRPATADIYSAGFVLQPNRLPDFRFSLQYTAIDQRDIAGGIGFNNILVDVNRLGSQSIFFNNVAKNNFPGLPGAVQFQNPGDLLAYLNAAPGVNNNNLYAIDQFRNLGGIQLRTVDMTLDYTWRTEHGDLTLSSLATYLASYKYQALPFQPFFEFAGVVSNSPQAGGTQPRWRFYTTLEWSRGPWDALLANSYIEGVKDEGAGGFTFANANFIPQKTSAYATFDARLAYKIGETQMLRLREARIAVGVNNMFDRRPPAAPRAFPDNGADISTYSPIGRLWYVQLMGRF
jgi:iron complex outermembrane receptor protein